MCVYNVALGHQQLGFTFILNEQRYSKCIIHTYVYTYGYACMYIFLYSIYMYICMYIIFVMLQLKRIEVRHRLTKCYLFQLQKRQTILRKLHVTLMDLL